MPRLLFVLLVLSGCTSALDPKTHTPVTVLGERSYFVDDSAPSRSVLQAAVDAAVAGDDATLAYVIQLHCFTDGEGSLNFGDLLLQICRRIGGARFSGVMASLPAQVRDGAASCMDAAEGTRRAYERYDEYVRQHPKT
jgi:hypothetical protein